MSTTTLRLLRATARGTAHFAGHHPAMSIADFTRPLELWRDRRPGYGRDVLPEFAHAWRHGALTGHYSDTYGYR